MSHTLLIRQGFMKNTPAPETFDEFLDRVLDELYELDIEADYLADMSALVAEWTITVPKDDAYEAAQEALGVLRTALHAAECNTAAWNPLPVPPTMTPTQQNADLLSA